jgi:hypothetical protein
MCLCASSLYNVTVLAVFFTYLLISSVVNAVDTGDLRELGVSIVFVAILCFAIIQKRAWRARQRNAAVLGPHGVILVEGINDAAAGNRAQRGVPAAVRKNFEVFRVPPDGSIPDNRSTIATQNSDAHSSRSDAPAFEPTSADIENAQSASGEDFESGCVICLVSSQAYLTSHV